VLRRGASVWAAAELLTGYERDIESFDLLPGTTGEFEFAINGELAYSKKATGEFPDLKVLKQAVVEAIDARAGAPTTR
jgi:selT/selW/selH-like putative selenoprotein